MLLLVLFTCQSVMAGIGEHMAFSSDGEAMNAPHLGAGDHFTNGTLDPGQPNTPDFLDTNCCHAHGHCHALAFVGQVVNASYWSGPSVAWSHTRSYQSLYLDTLLRPPSSV